MLAPALRRFAAAAAAALLLPIGALAATLELSPVVHDLPAGRSALATTVVNRGEAPVTVQVRGFTWSQHDGRDDLTRADDVVLSPPMFTLAPGGRQLVRVLLPAAASAREGSWRLLFDEIPVAGDDTAWRFALRLSVPVFRAADTALPPALQWQLDAAQGLLVVRNHGGSRERVRELALQAAGGQKVVLEAGGPGWVLAGAERRWPLPATAVTLARAAPLTLFAATDGGRVEVALAPPR